MENIYNVNWGATIDQSSGLYVIDLINKTKNGSFFLPDKSSQAHMYKIYTWQWPSRADANV